VGHFFWLLQVLAQTRKLYLTFHTHGRILDGRNHHARATSPGSSRLCDLRRRGPGWLRVGREHCPPAHAAGGAPMEIARLTLWRSATNILRAPFGDGCRLAVNETLRYGSDFEHFT
jgi:hypothetical protein